jgi:hypothetical protein
MVLVSILLVLMFFRYYRKRFTRMIIGTLILIFFKFINFSNFYCLWFCTFIYIYVYSSFCFVIINQFRFCKPYIYNYLHRNRYIIILFMSLLNYSKIKLRSMVCWWNNWSLLWYMFHMGYLCEKYFIVKWCSVPWRLYSCKLCFFNFRVLILILLILAFILPNTVNVSFIVYNWNTFQIHSPIERDKGEIKIFWK